VTWLGKAAVLWALDEAPDVPPHLVAALIAVARYAGEDGRGAHPSAATIAAHIRKTERSAKKDLAELRELGLLLPGNPRIVAHVRADQRPAVYDLPVPRGVAHDTPSSPNGVSCATARGVAQGPDGVSHTTPEEILNRSLKSARAASGDDAPRAHLENPALVADTIAQLRAGFAAKGRRR
jgi:hypothetical protein